jgi:hypothetical protein
MATNNIEKTHQQKIREAVADIGEGSAKKIIDWIENHYGKVNKQSYRADVIGSSINHGSQHHYPHMQKFLWFNKETKKYRMAQPSEMHIEVKEEVEGTKTIGLIAKEENCIDGVPVGRLSVNGQVLIPLQIREQQGFNAGDILAFVVNDKGVLEVKKARIRLDFS